jgi:hypothetical protein
MQKAGVERPVLVAPATHEETDVETEFVRAVDQELGGVVDTVMVELDGR